MNLESVIDLLGCVPLLQKLPSSSLRAEAEVIVVKRYVPIIYQVHRLSDGNSFATRRVDAIQNGNIIFTLLASFQCKQFMGTIGYIRTYRNKVASMTFIPWPIEIRFCEPSNATDQTKSPPSLKYWFRARGKLSDDQALHRCVQVCSSAYF